MKKKITIVFFSLSCILISCSGDDSTIPEEDNNTSVGQDEIITIPVVVHVVNYAPEPFEISDDKIKSQIKVLNQDFRMKNEDLSKTPDEFKPFIADIKIEFKLATTSPEGQPTKGIIRTMGNVTGFDGKRDEGESIEDLALFFTDKGGQDAWPNDQYLNIWIAYFRDIDNQVVYAFSSAPGDDPRIDGIAIDPNAFGTLAPLQNGVHKGRTATHEIGHWLGLKHTYGTAFNCSSSDDVKDTPQQSRIYYGKPKHPQTSCGSNDMFMNFMNHADDDVMHMFTKGQKEKMRAIFNPGSPRRALYINIKNN
ncbi:zinc metalloprotease [Aquimarina sp. TRL1]|uniref:M43 family zinc metalloprotease n=1 Tax=Aquimarina sp. (strain TRL1) TaxID=2736252 RepID=UPI00158D2B78|nr:M43 family zinc metalloprotease [Aquimarina sp. TRL1]QKX05622.1 zinc metalloprotease [Aquimarina sp. TRL1]